MVVINEKIQKATKVKKKKSSKKLPEWFGPRTIDPICFHKEGVINQRKDGWSV